ARRPAGDPVHRAAGDGRRRSRRRRRIEEFRARACSWDWIATLERKQVIDQRARLSLRNDDTIFRGAWARNDDHTVAGLHRPGRLLLEEERKSWHDRPGNDRARVVEMNELPVSIGEALADVDQIR